MAHFLKKPKRTFSNDGTFPASFSSYLSSLQINTANDRIRTTDLRKRFANYNTEPETICLLKETGVLLLRTS